MMADALFDGARKMTEAEIENQSPQLSSPEYGSSRGRQTASVPTSTGGEN